VELPRDAIEDPMHFRSGGVDPGRDGCRVPLPWSGSASPFGFGGAPWLPQPADWAAYAVDTQELDRSSTLWLYRDAIALRRRLPDLDGDALAWLELGADVLAFRRGEDTVSITNLGAVPVPLPAHHEVLLSSAPLDGGLLAPDCTAWLALRPASAHPDRAH
jgi:alpha-glucosidase